MPSTALLDRVAESVGVPISELKQYVMNELDEFLAATTPAEMEAEFEDTLFALRCLAWAHSGRHLDLRLESVEQKVRHRLRSYATVRRSRPKYSDDRIPDLEIGVVHLAFGRFGGQWQRFDAFRNGTIAEISLLTDVGVGPSGTLRNHCIVTFADTSRIEYDILHSSTDTNGGNTIRCQIPRFLFARAKQEDALSQFSDDLSLQVLAALDGLRLAHDTIVHFHSWEGGFLCGSTEFRDRIADCRTYFSPYLTTGRLETVVTQLGGSGWTLSGAELSVAANYERTLSAMAKRVVLESEMDREFFRSFVPGERIDVRTFARVRSAEYDSAPRERHRLRFLAGGRPVREKGFVELCREFSYIRTWADNHDLEVKLEILCREHNGSKGADYLEKIGETITALGMEDLISLELKVPLDRLLDRIADADALIAPSLFDPYCLMPTYAVEKRRPVFVSRQAGVSENIVSEAFLFSPNKDGDLASAITKWYAMPMAFKFESKFPSYDGIYRFRDG